MDDASGRISTIGDEIHIGNGAPPPAAGKPAQRLEDLAKSWRKAQGNDGTWPLRIAADVCAVIENWSAYSDQAEGKTASAYLKTIFGDGGAGRVQWWKARREAVEILGEHVRRKLHHETAIALKDLPVAERDECMKRLLERTVQQRGVVLTTAQASKIIREVRGVQGTHRVCEKCAEKDRRIAELEAELVSVRARRH